MSDLFVTKLAGVTFDGRQILLKKLTEDTNLKLVREKDNQYDKNAVGVLAYIRTYNKIAGWVNKWQHIGYIPKEIASHLSVLIDENKVDMDDVYVLNIFNQDREDSNMGVEICINHIEVKNFESFMEERNAVS